MNPKSWKPAGMEGLFWMKGLPIASLGSCLWTSALWRSNPRCVRKVTQQMSHLSGLSEWVSMWVSSPYLQANSLKHTGQ